MTDARDEITVLRQRLADARQALLRAHAAYAGRTLACVGCDRPLHRQPGPGRDPRWCSAACRARFRRATATFAPRAPQGAHVPR